jgi:hypothetical protein
MTGFLSVAAFRGDLTSVLAGFRSGKTRAFSFGDGVPEAVALTYDEFEDLGGEGKFAVGDVVLEPGMLSERLVEVMEAIRAGRADPVVFGQEGEPEAVLLSTADYRRLRGDDEPPAGVADDPTQRTYATKPLPTSRRIDLDEWAAQMGPETQQILDEIRREDGAGA